MKLFGEYCKSRRGTFLYFSAAALLLGASFALYHLPLRAVVSPLALAAAAGIAALALDFRRVYKLHRELSQLENTAAELLGVLPPAQSVPEADYQAIVRSLLADLGRIERYVEMVLTYLRLEGEGTDYVFRETELDGIVRASLRRFAGEFIDRRLTLDYTPSDVRVLTDEKWLSFVIEQVLSNALKYTPRGGVSVYVEEPKTLCVRDTGIGITPEDLPRIFERSYTGLHGRSDKRASGIGLYLCRRICRNLGHTITAESVPGAGTTVRIALEKEKITVE